MEFCLETTLAAVCECWCTLCFWKGELWQGIPIKEPNSELAWASWAIWNQQQWQPFPLPPSFPSCRKGKEPSSSRSGVLIWGSRRLCWVEEHCLGHCWSWGTPLGVVVEVLWRSELWKGLGFSAWQVPEQGDSHPTSLLPQKEASFCPYHSCDSSQQLQVSFSGHWWNGCQTNSTQKKIWEDTESPRQLTEVSCVLEVTESHHS